MKPTLFYLLPVMMSSGRSGAEELVRRRTILEAWTDGAASIEIGELENGATSIESFADEALSITPTLVKVRQVLETGPSAIIMGCFADTMLEAAREISSRPVIGPGEASMHYAAMLSDRFTIITTVPTVVPLIRRSVRQYKMESHLASILPVGVPVARVAGSGQGSRRRLVEYGRRAIEQDGAQSLIIGCLSMCFEAGLIDEIQSELEVPVLNPARIAVDFAISLCRQNLTHRAAVSGSHGITATRAE